MALNNEIRDGPMNNNGVMVRLFEEGDQEGVDEAIKLSFGNSSSNAYPFPPKKMVVIAESGGQIIGHVSVRPYLFSIRGRPVPCGILHMVGTVPAWQKKGVGHAMLDACVEIMDEKKIPLSVLKTPVPVFYAKKGWDTVRGHSDRYVISKDVFEARRVSELPNDPKVDIKDGITAPTSLLHECIKRGHLPSLTAFPTSRAFQAWLEERCCDSIVKFIHEIHVEGNLAGFIAGERMATLKEGERLSIEIGDVYLKEMDQEMTSMVMCSLVEKLFQFDDEFVEIYFACPLNKPWIDAAVSAGAQLERREPEIKDMVRINDLGGLLRLIVPVLQANWKGREKKELVHPTINLSIGKAQAAQFRFDDDHVSIGEPMGKEREPCVALHSTEGSASLLCGEISPSELLKSGLSTATSESVVRQLDSLFPKHPVQVKYETQSFELFLGEIKLD